MSNNNNLKATKQVVCKVLLKYNLWDNYTLGVSSPHIFFFLDSCPSTTFRFTPPFFVPFFEDDDSRSLFFLDPPVKRSVFSLDIYLGITRSLLECVLVDDQKEASRLRIFVRKAGSRRADEGRLVSLIWYNLKLGCRSPL